MADTTVNLDVRNNVSTDPGWKPSTGTTGYSYLFSGGNADDPDNPGGFKFERQGPGNAPKTVDIELVADPRYQITNVGVTYDKRGGREPPADISIPPGNRSGRKWTIRDTDLDDESGYFNVTVKFGDVTGIVCDPRWQNEN